ncbi:MAG: hypothetical protein AMXMBFR7_09300 [Planctomycetota bacterium]
MHGRRLAIMVLLSFGSALLLGRAIFSQRGTQPTEEQRGTEADRLPLAHLVAAQPEREGAADADGFRVPAGLEPVDRTLEVTPEAVQNVNNRMATVFSSDYHEGVLHRRDFGHRASLRWVPQGQDFRVGFDRVHEVPAQVGSRAEVVDAGEAQRVVYRGTYPGVDERFEVRTDGGVEHDFILNERAEIPANAESMTFHGRIELSRGMTVWDGAIQVQGRYKATQGLEFKDARGNTAFRLSRGVAYDKQVTLPNGRCDMEKLSEDARNAVLCEYFVEPREDGGIDLAIAVPAKWLSDSRRTYPVVVDPNIGPGGLSDASLAGGIPFYTGTAAGSQNFGLINGNATQLTFPFVCATKFDDAADFIVMPFNFVYYGILRGPGTPFPILWVHLNGYASWAAPFPPDPISQCPVLCSQPEFVNGPIPTAGCPLDAFFVYHDDLRLSGQPNTGVYWLLQGQTGNRRLIVEWFKMGFVGGAANEVITFQLILYECNNTIQFNLILDESEVDRQRASIGIENPSGTIGIQYDFDSITAGAPDPAGQPTALPPITPGTAVTFVPALGANLNVTVDGNILTAGQAYDPGSCIPARSCFVANVTPPVISCGGAGPAIPPSFGFQWQITVPDPNTGGTSLIALYNTRSFCRTFTTPGALRIQLVVIDSFGVPSVFGPFTYQACDFPRVLISADPQGGNVPLAVNFFSNSISSTIDYRAFDDANTFPVGTRLTAPTDVAVTAGADGQLHTRPVGDDLIDNSTSPPQILVGLNLVIDTKAANGGAVIVAGDPVAGLTTVPGGDDVIVGNNIVDGGNGTAETTALPPDLQIIALNDLTPPGASLFWEIERYIEPFLGTPPVFYASMTPGDAAPQFTFTEPGIYRVTANWTGVDVVTNLPTLGKYPVYVFTEDPNTPVDDNMVIEASTFSVAWKGKTDGPDPDILPDDPNKDSFTVRGTLSLPELTPSMIASRHLRANLIVNANTLVFDVGNGRLNPNGTLTVKSLSPGGGTSKFQLKLPNGSFLISSTKLKLDETLGVRNLFERSLLPAHIRLELWDLTIPSTPVLIYPQDPNTRGSIITYSYNSVRDGAAVGSYKLGAFTGDGVYTTPAGQLLGKLGGQSVLASSAFLVKKATFKLKGSQVTSDISGVMARFGGDDLRPVGLSDVEVTIGGGADSIATGFSETLNFQTSPRFKTRAPSNDPGLKKAIFSFVRDTRVLGATGIKTLTWANLGGAFRVVTFPMDNASTVGIDVTRQYQTVDLKLSIINENSTGSGLQSFNGEAQFMVERSGATTFVRK